MPTILQELYHLACETIQVDPEYQDKHRALARAKLALLDQLEEDLGPERLALMDALNSLDGEAQELYQLALFQAALCFGLELGRLQGV